MALFNLTIFTSETLAAPPSSSSLIKKKSLKKSKLLLSQKKMNLTEALPFEGQSIKSIEVLGAKKVEAAAILSKVSLKPESLLTVELLRADIKSLFSMGFFEDISFLGEAISGGVKLIIQVKERPIISKITFNGNENQTKEELEKIIKVKQWSILETNKINDDINFLLKHYEDKGFYLTKVQYEIKEVKNGEVELIYKVNDYEKVQIKKITFLNNKAFTDEQLKANFMETKEGGFFSFLSSSGNFKESAFKTDLQRLTYWYLDQGYVKFKFETPSVTISDDKRFVYITVSVDEGEKYKMGQIDFSGDLLFSREELGQEILLKQDESFSITRRNADIQKLTEKFQDLGYAFANVIPKMDVKDDTKRVNIDYAFEKGNLAYFGEVTIVGNTKTHDKVMRRELKIKEGELYNGSRLRESRENVERLGFFQPGEVLFNSTTPKGKNDVVDIEIQVKERPTGTVTLGAGYGSAQGLFFTTTVSESNFLGRGQNLSLSTNISRDKRNKSMNVGWSDPYFMDSKWNFGVDGYYVIFNIPSRYSTRRFGGDVRLGYPLYEFTNGFMTYKRERMKIDQLNFKNPSVEDLDDLDADDGTLSSVVWSVVRDKRNNRFETSGGNYQSISLETAGASFLGGDKQFFKWSLNNRFYTKVVGDLVFRNNIEFGQINGFGGVRIPPSEKYYLGGPNNLRGYEFFTVGSSRKGKDTNDRDITIPLGGTTQLYSMVEMDYPIIREAGLKFVAFFDVGNLYNSFEDVKDFSLRSNYGFGVRWFSPIGPLRFEWGFPLHPREGESSSVFQFFIGPPF